MLGSRFLILAAAAALLAPGAAALEIRKGEGEGSRVTIGAGETIDDNVIAAGETVVVEGTITGNLLAFGRTLEIRGEVQGDVLAAGEKIEATGRVGGNWISFSRRLTASAMVERSVAAFGESVEWRGEAKGDLAAFASEVTLAGPLGRDAYLFGAEIEATSSVGGDLNAWTGKLEVGPQASVGGDLTARVGADEQVSIAPGASIAGMTSTLVGDHKPAAGKSSRTASVVGSIVGFLAALVTGLALYWLFPALLGWRMESPRGVAIAGGIGFLILVATPFAALAAAISVVGLPVAFMAMMLWAAAIYLAKIAVAPAIAAVLLRKRELPAELGAFLGLLATGLAVFWVLRWIPILGGLASFVVAIVGMGVLGMRARAMWRGPTPAAPFVP